MENPAWLLIRALNTLRDGTGKILIKDWYTEVKKFTEQEELLISEEPFSEGEFKKHYGIDRFLIDRRKGGESKALVGQSYM